MKTIDLYWYILKIDRFWIEIAIVVSDFSELYRIEVNLRSNSDRDIDSKSLIRFRDPNRISLQLTDVTNGGVNIDGCTWARKIMMTGSGPHRGVRMRGILDRKIKQIISKVKWCNMLHTLGQVMASILNMWYFRKMFFFRVNVEQ